MSRLLRFDWLACLPLLIGGALIPLPAHAQDAFITTWETTSAEESITIPTDSSNTAYDFTIDWGDGTTETITGTDPDPSHTYADAGIYTVEITGTFPRIFFNATGGGENPDPNAGRLQSIEQWGAIQWESMRRAFAGAENLTSDASDAPDLSGVTDMSRMFSGASNFNGDIGDWDVSGVTNMAFMFAGTGAFNQDIGSWNVSNVTDMQFMFFGAARFNQPIGSWDVSSVENMTAMFQSAPRFDQDLGGWDVSNVANFNDFLTQVGLSPENYDALLNGWSSLDLVDGLTFDAGSSQYTAAAAAARQSIIDEENWTINDGGQTDGGGKAFITTWETTSAEESITIPTDSSNTAYDFTVDWGDGTTETITGTDPDPSHTYADAGIYTVEITGTFPRIFFNATGGGENPDPNAGRLQSIEQWGAIQWESMRRAFAGAENLTSNASDAPDVSGVTDMSGMFAGASSFNGDLGNWDVSGVTNMSVMFDGASSFNQDLSSWEVSSVTEMNVMFRDAEAFNQDISPWDVSSVTEMSGMFLRANAFNQDIGQWDVSNVTDMDAMFQNADSFNQDLGRWEVSGVTDMQRMFFGATSFDQDLGEWDVSNVTNFNGFLKQTELSPENYDALLTGWAALDLVDGLTFNAGSSQYTAAATAARQSIIDEENWTINDGGQTEDGDPVPALSVVTLPPVEVTGTSARLRGKIDPKGGSADVTFVYYKLQSGDNGPEQRVGAGTVTASQEVSKEIPTSGELETNQKYGYYVEAEDEDRTVSGAEATFTATETSIEFVESGPFEIEEDASVDAVVGDVDATDGSGPDKGITYQITGGNDPDENTKDAFTIASANGAITVAHPEELDFEERRQYFLTVKASSEDGDGNSRKAAVDINVLDVTEPVSSLVATPDVRGTLETGNSQVRLEWDSPSDGSSDIDRYNIYRSPTPIPRTASPSDREPVATAEPDVSEPTVDAEPNMGQTYYYRLTAVRSSGEEGAFSDQASAFTYPEEVGAQVERTFGQGNRKQDYRLVALPGQAISFPDPEIEEPRPLRGTLPGAEDKTWRAFWDDGTASDYYVEHDGTETFQVQPGDGFWVLSTKDWTDENTYPTVELEGDSAAVVGLHDGWNIISNPTGKDVSWDHVRTENGLSDETALWRFDGTFGSTRTLLSAQTGTSFYFLNDTGLEALRVPYPGSPPEIRDETSGKSPRAASTPDRSSTPTIMLEASRNDSTTSTATVQLTEAADEGFDSSDVLAPTSRFSALGLRLENPDADHGPRRGYLATERRPEGNAAGQAFSLRLWGRTDGPVTLTVVQMYNVGAREATLIVPERRSAHNLQQGTEVSLSAEADTTKLRLAVGEQTYVQEHEQRLIPDDVRLEAYPTPARRQATLQYTLPEPKTVRLGIYDVLGRKVTTVTNGRREAGQHRTQIDVSGLSGGVYFGRLELDNQMRTQKIVVVK